MANQIKIYFKKGGNTTYCDYTSDEKQRIIEHSLPVSTCFGGKMIKVSTYGWSYDKEEYKLLSEDYFSVDNVEKIEVEQFELVVK